MLALGWHGGIHFNANGSHYQVETTPFPAKGLKPVHTAMYKGQQKLGVEGELHLLATVDAQGNVEEVKTYDSPSPEMTQYAAAVVLGTKFKPAICSDMPCRMDFRFSYQFVRTR